ncbi:ECF-type sigma factor [Stieleria marina]|uniref:RNA polymerase sigma factor SigY n=1 Tax=Stieleria marina TaxID=1930275 RepID=A0A517P094_9BACT|nr:RNA polymerase sigma factor SigY [Planctomycetes bacterium K23_9]
MEPEELTVILQRAKTGDESAQAKLFAAALDELHGAASALMQQERASHTLQPSALINEAALRLLKSNALESMPDRAYFFGSMVRAMRHVLIDHARARKAKRRQGNQVAVSLDYAIDVMEKQAGVDLIELDQALQELANQRERTSRIVELRFFGGMSQQEIADQMSLSLATVNREWRYARAWLRDRLDNTQSE